MGGTKEVRAAALGTQACLVQGRHWMKTGKYEGTYDDFDGVYYKGTIHMFTWVASGLDFWYDAKADGTPVQQGEGCYSPKGKKPKACKKMLPIVLYHDFDPTKFKNATFTQSDFEVPDICTNTKVSCSIPGASYAVVV